MTSRAIELEWQGETFLIPENETFEVAGEVEEIIDLAQLHEFQSAPKFTKLAKCYGVMLRHAGARVTDQEVHQEIIRGTFTDGQKAQAAMQAVTILTHLLLGGMPVDGSEDEGADKKKPRKSSNPATKSRSRNTKSRQGNSGG